MEVLPMQGILSIDVVTAIPAIVALLFIPIPQPARPSMPAAAGRPLSVLDDLRVGLQCILSWKALLMLAAIGIVINMLGRAAGSLLPLLVAQHFHARAVEFEWLESMAGIGTVLGGVILGFLRGWS